MILGKNGKWKWVTAKNVELWRVIDRCPLLVNGRFVQVTAFDNAPLKLTDEELASGWAYLGNNALSPRVVLDDDFPCAEGDEWYVFTSKPEKEVKHIFVYYFGFRLTAGYAGMHQLDGIPEEEQFWEQLNEINPHAYISCGDNLVFVTANHDLYESVMINIQCSEWDRYEEQTPPEEQGCGQE